ncbi:MAG: leucyl/phenylalanyl-tRNA--protein transferase [Acidobacteria bacterium]|nr:leucyl/phenylalanyl-tRNA--protein transferase [Acidobacteriota bacterium]
MHGDAFPDPAEYDYAEWVIIGDYMYRADDVVAFGTPLTKETVREAYSKGIFPWNTEGVPLPWHCPKRRAVLEFADLKIPRSLEKERRKERFTFTIDREFRRVMRECALSFRPGQRGTWITPDFERVYGKLHDEGMAHSVEAWLHGELVGGLYGVDAGGVFCGESMFYREPNASKLALLFLIDHLRSRGSTWFDAQVMTPHLKALGAKEIDRGEFLRRLKRVQDRGRPLFPSSEHTEN